MMVQLKTKDKTNGRKQNSQTRIEAIAAQAGNDSGRDGGSSAEVDSGRLGKNQEQNIQALRALQESAGNVWTAHDQALAERVFSEGFTEYVIHATYADKIPGTSTTGLDPAKSPDYHYTDELGKRLSFAEAGKMANPLSPFLFNDYYFILFVIWVFHRLHISDYCFIADLFF